MLLLQIDAIWALGRGRPGAECTAAATASRTATARIVWQTVPHQQPKSSDANSFALADDNSDTALFEPISERVSYDMIN